MMRFADILGIAQTPYTVKYNEIYDPVGYYFESVFLGQMDAETAVKNAQRK